MKDRLPVVLDVVGFGLLVVAGFLVTPVVGFCVAGVAFILAGWRFQS